MEPKKALGARASTDAASLVAGDSLGIVLVCAHAVFDVVIDNEIEFFVAEPIMRS